MLQSRRNWYDIFKLMKTEDPQARIYYPQGSHSNFTEKSKLYSFTDKQKLRKEFITRKSALQQIINELLQVRKTREEKKKGKGKKNTIENKTITNRKAHW